MTLCGDTPLNKETQVILGKGPAVHIKDVGTIADPRVTEWIKKGAKRSRIAVQTSILTRGYTDTYTIQTSKAGVPSGGISIPCRYVHSPSEMVDVSDLNETVKLLVALLIKADQVSEDRNRDLRFTQTAVLLVGFTGDHYCRVQCNFTRSADRTPQS